MNRWRVGEDRGSKETDGCPLTVKGIESKMATLIWCTAPGYLQWNCTIFGSACICVCLSHSL
jgi:hypothetical protein